MPSERFERIAELCADAFERPADDRMAFLEDACQNDEALIREVVSLIEADEKAGAFLAEPEHGTGASPAASRPRAVGPYRLLHRLGSGGLGTVYAAVRADQTFHRRVAIKLLRQEMASEEHLRRFQTERQILASLEHPNIARLYDGGTEGGTLPYLVMELVEGETIDVYCDRRRLDIEQRLDLFVEVCAAVHFAHQNLIVHRDIKPSNILVTAQGVPKLVDFGIAKLLNPDLSPQSAYPTAVGSRLMTPEFASPEQLAGGIITTASDVFALGAVLHLLLTGRLPWRGARRMTVDGSEQVVRPSTLFGRGGETAARAACVARCIRGEPLRRKLAGDLDNIVLMALRPEPQRRYASAEQLADDVRRHRQGLPVRARAATLPYRLSSFVRRNKVAAGAVAALLVALTGFVAALSLQARRTGQERDRAEATLAFLEDILEVADPAEGRGETATLREALDLGASRIDGLADQPLVQASLQHALGKVYLNLSLFDDAEPLLRRALETRRSSLGNSDRRTHETRNRLALLVSYRARYGEAEELARRSVADARALGGDHQVLAESLRILGVVNMGAYDLPEAEDAQRQALAMRRRLFGPRHREVAQSLIDLATVRTEAGDYDEAGAMLEEALAIVRAAPDARPGDLATALASLGATLHERGEESQAEPYLRQAIALGEARLGPDHATVLDRLNTLAVVLDKLGRFGEAQVAYGRVLRAQRARFGENHPLVAMALHNLATSVDKAGDARRADGLYRRSLAAARASLQPEHPGLAYVLVRYGLLAARLDEPGLCETRVREAVAIRRQSLPAGNWLTAQAENALGACLIALGRFEEAEPLLQGSLAVIEATRDAGDDEIRTAIGRLVELYEGWGRSDDAARARARFQAAL